MFVSLFLPTYSLLSVIGIFLCTVICIADQEPTTASFVIFYHLAVALGLFQYPVLVILLIARNILIINTNWNDKMTKETN